MLRAWLLPGLWLLLRRRLWWGLRLLPPRLLLLWLSLSCQRGHLLRKGGDELLERRDV